MENAELYVEFSSFQKRAAGEVFAEFVDSHPEYFPKTGKMLDVGCGPGDTLVNHMFPSLKESQLDVVGIHVSRNGVDLANANYQNESRKFFVWDIQNGIDEVEDLKPESLNLVTSSFCYHWIRDEK